MFLNLIISPNLTQIYIPCKVAALNGTRQVTRQLGESSYLIWNLKYKLQYRQGHSKYAP